MGCYILIGSLLVLLCGIANASFIGTISENADLSLLTELVEALQIQSADIPADSLVTVLAPTNQAIKQFCSDMGLTYQQLKERPELIDSLISYHIVPGAKADTSLIKEQISSNSTAPTLAGTLNPDFFLRFHKAGGKLFVTDAQDNSAEVSLPGTASGTTGVVYKVNRVLLNGEVFHNLPAFFDFYQRFSKFSRALAAAGVPTSNPTSSTGSTKTKPQPTPGFADTLLVVRNSAVEGLNIGPAVKQSDLAATVAKYHVIQGYRPIPMGLKPGAWYSTLLTGHSLSVKQNRSRVDVPSSSGNVSVELLSVQVLPEPGSPSKPVAVNLHNIFVGQGVVHGVDGCLLPKPTPATTNSATGSTPVKANSAASSTSVKTPAAPAQASTATTKANTAPITATASAAPQSAKAVPPTKPLAGLAGLIAAVQPGSKPIITLAKTGRRLLLSTDEAVATRSFQETSGQDTRSSSHDWDSEIQSLAAPGLRQLQAAHRGGFGGFRAAGDFDRRAEAPAFRAPEYSPDFRSMSNTANGLRLGNSWRGAIINSGNNIGGFGPRRGVNIGSINTGVGVGVGAGLGALAGSIPAYGAYGVPVADDYEPVPAPTPVIVNAPVSVTDYSVAASPTPEDYAPSG